MDLRQRGLTWIVLANDVLDRQGTMNEVPWRLTTLAPHLADSQAAALQWTCHGLLARHGLLANTRLCDICQQTCTFTRYAGGLRWV